MTDTYSNDTVSIQETPFQSAAMHRPVSLGPPAFKIAAIDFKIQFVLFLFNFSLSLSASMPCQPVEEVA